MERVLQKSKILVTFLVLPKILKFDFQFKVTGKIKILVTFLVLPKILKFESLPVQSDWDQPKLEFSYFKFLNN